MLSPTPGLANIHKSKENDARNESLDKSIWNTRLRQNRDTAIRPLRVAPNSKLQTEQQTDFFFLPVRTPRSTPQKKQLMIIHLKRTNQLFHRHLDKARGVLLVHEATLDRQNHHEAGCDTQGCVSQLLPMPVGVK